LVKLKASHTEEKTKLEEELTKLRASYMREQASADAQRMMLQGSLLEVKAARDAAVASAATAAAEAAAAKEKTVEARRQATMVEEQAAEALRRAAMQAAAAQDAQRAAAAAQLQLERDRADFAAQSAVLFAEVEIVRTELQQSQDAAQTAAQRAEEYAQITLHLCDQLEAARTQAAQLRGAVDVMELALEEMRGQMDDICIEHDGAVQKLAEQTARVAAAEAELATARMELMSVQLSEAALRAERDEALSGATVLRQQLAAATAIAQHERESASQAAAEAAATIKQLQEHSSSSLQQCQELQQEVNKLRATLASLEAQDNHRSCIFDLATVELAELSQAGAQLHALGRAGSSLSCRRRSH